MMAPALVILQRAVLLLVLAVALTATGFAHRMPAPQDSALAFALANGAEASDFCGGAPGSDRNGAAHCPACQITAGADLPSISALGIDLKPAFGARVVAPRESRSFPVTRDPAHGPQGPPVA